MTEGARIACIVGPTASGKSDVAQIVACTLGGEVVSADSMQVYRGMDIGTGKVFPADRKVTHHCIDIVDPGEPYSVALFQRDARAAFTDIANRNSLPILAGGTGFYVRAAIDAYDFPDGEQAANPVRERYAALADDQGSQAVWDELARLDARSAALVHPHNTKRVIRALELHHLGISYADQVDALQNIAQTVPACMIGLFIDPEELTVRIGRRADHMREAGLVNEVEDLLHKGFRAGLTAPQAIGYKEIVSALDGCISMDQAFDDIKRATCRYAKRQRSWFRRDGRIVWIDATERSVQDAACEAVDIIRRDLDMRG